MLSLLVAVALGSAAAGAAANDPNPTVKPLENLTLDQALETSESLQPELAEARAMVQAAEGRLQQAGTFANPEAILGAQQIPFRGGAPSEKEHVAGVAQTIPLGGRLRKARQAEALERESRAHALEVKRRDIRRRVHEAYAVALYQEKAHQAQAEIQRNTQTAVTVTQARVEAGDALRDDLARMEMELARATVELQRAESLHKQALVALASAMGDASLSVTSLDGTLEVTFEIPALESLTATLSAQPESAQAEADVRARSAHVDLARSERIPDVKVELLYHRLEASRQNTFDLGLSIPLPLFNRNQGRIRAARAEMAAAEARSRMTQNELSLRLRESHLQLTAALANSRLLKDEILVRAETVLKSAEARYAAGDTSLSEILPLRREGAAVQLSYLESLRDVMQAWAEVKSFAGRN